MFLEHQKKLIAAVKKHARDNYESSGWDYVVECYDDTEILALVAECKTEEEAIEVVHKEVLIRDEYRKDIQAEIF